MTGPQRPADLRDSPYFGLDYYDERFGAWFFGRESDGSKIITNLRAARLTLLHAESGVGKTSLLRAGVAWRLHRLADDLFARGRPVRSIPVVFSSWKDDPATELAAAVSVAVQPYLPDGADPGRPDGGLDAAIARASEAANAGLVIMLDQFEEYFLYRSRELVPDRFADELARCVNRTDLRANFLIAIREDAYAELGDLFKGRIPNVYGNYLHIDYLDRASAEQAIRGPLKVYNNQPGVTQPVTVQDQLVETVLDEVRAFGPGGDGAVPLAAADGRRDRIATPLLQLVMQKVWDTERAGGSPRLRVSTLEQLHGVRTIVDAHLGTALGSLGRAEREAAIDMFDHLVTPSGGKIAESVSDLAKRTGHTEAQVDGVLRKLDDERILRPVPAAPGQDPVRSRRYEIFHDVLASPINRAIAAREDQRHVRRIRRLAALAVGLLVIVAAVAVVFGYLLNSANTEKLTAQSRQLAADAYVHLGSDPELSTSLALQALQLRSTSQAADALRTALPDLQLLKTFQDGATVTAAAFDPADANKVASADQSGVWIWDVRTGQRLERLSGGVATAEAFNPAGTQLAVGYEDGDVDVFDVRSGTIQATDDDNGLCFAPGQISDLEFAGNTGELAITTGGYLFLWQYQNAQFSSCNPQIPVPASVTLVDTDPHDPGKFATTTSDGIYLVDESGNPLQLSSQAATDARFSPDGSEVVAVATDGSVQIYSVATRRVVTTLSPVGTSALTAAFSPDGKQVVVGYLNGTGRVWDIATKLQLTLLSGHSGQIASAQFSPDGREVVTASADGTTRVWYAEPRELQTEFSVPQKRGAQVGVARAQYIANRIITTDGSGNVFVYSASGERRAEITPGRTSQVAGWDRSGTKVVTLNPEGTVQVWHAAGSSYTRVSLQSPIILDGYLPQVSMAMSPDGSRLALIFGDSTGDADINYDTGNFAQVRSVVTGGVLETLDAAEQITALAFNPDGHQIIGADAAGQVEVWDGAATESELLGAPGPSLNDVSFNQSGSEFVTSSAGGVVTVWDARTGRVLDPIDACPSPNSAAFSPDGSNIVVACTDGTVRVFDTATGRTLTVIQAASAGIVADAGYSPDGKTIVAGIDTGTTSSIEIWNAELATSSLPALERIAGQRVGDKLTSAQQQQYLSGASS